MELQKKHKKAILVVSFGTSYPCTRKLTIDAIEKRIKENFSEYEVRRAFTSDIIRRKIEKQENIIVDNTKVALEKMKEEGFREVIVQPLHIIPGIEYDKIKETLNNFQGAFEKLCLGTPMLYDKEDYSRVIDAIKNQIPTMKSNEGLVFMAHGTSHYANSCYALLQYLLEESGYENVFVSTLGAYPSLDNVIRRIKNKEINSVLLMPFMLVAGEHVKNQMVGDKEDSWKNKLESKGIKVKVYNHGLGENLLIQDIYVSKIKNLILN